MTLELNRVHNLDVLEFAALLPEETADMIFIDPPYNIKARGGRFDENVSNWPEYFSWCMDWIQEARRILKPTGSLFLKCPARTSGHYQVLLDQAGLHYRNQIILLCAVHPSSKAYLTSHEVLYYYAKDIKQVFFNHLAELWLRDQNKNWWYKEKYRNPDGDRISDLWLDIKTMPAGSLINSETILKAGTRLKFHPNQMPIKIAERCITFTTKPYGLVVDFFAGSGTVPAAAMKLNRVFYACETDEDFCRLANVRSGQRVIDFQQKELERMETACIEGRQEEISKGVD